MVPQGGKHRDRLILSVSVTANSPLRRAARARCSQLHLPVLPPALPTQPYSWRGPWSPEATGLVYDLVTGAALPLLHTDLSSTYSEG